MKNFFKTILVCFYFTTTILVCFSMGQQDEPQTNAPKQDREKTVDKEQNLPYGWKYEEETTNEGTRSQGKLFRLYYRYSEIQPVFSKVIINNKIYNYKSMDHPWDSYGYLYNNETIGKPSITEHNITSDDLEKGWYESTFYEQKRGTPSEWVFLGRNDISVWIAPEKIESFTKENDFGEILTF
ncbi:MAG: hypothetical protein PQJ46_12580 [Spirochaetales bacterium]|nr:hypothetical protein [Spirochaetales bacterium]